MLWTVPAGSSVTNDKWLFISSSYRHSDSTLGEAAILVVEQMLPLRYSEFHWSSVCFSKATKKTTQL